MSIKGKLLLLIGLILLSFIVSIGFYFLILTPITIIEEEQQYLYDLQKEFHIEQIALSRLLHLSYDEQLKVFNESKNHVDNKFIQIQKIKLLKRFSGRIEESLDKIGNIQLKIAGNIKEFDNITGAILHHIDEIYGHAMFVEIKSLFTATSTMEIANVSSLFGDLKRLYDYIDFIDTDIDNAIKTIDTQMEIIESEIKMIVLIGRIITAVIIFIVLLTAFVISLIIANNIVKSFDRIACNIDVIKSGDLTSSFIVDKMDDFGKLCSNMNLFLNSLHGAISSIKNFARESVIIKQKLVTSIGNTSQNTEKISVTAETIRSGINNLDNHVKVSSTEINEISRKITDLHHKIEDQMAMVEESTSSITEMAASINNVSIISEIRKKAIDKLVATAEAGQEKLDNTINVINEINENVDSISGMAKIIQNISAQTNLLAMNASIEAAHAGDKGHGFAVVANEIRKLAEASSHNSKDITGKLKNIIAIIKEATVFSDETKNAFGDINNEIFGVSESLSEIFSSMNELQKGSEQILVAMNSLQDVSLNVKDDATVMTKSGQSVSHSMNELNMISSNFLDSTTEILSNIGNIVTSVDDVTKITEKIDNITETLDLEVNKFKTS